MAMQWGVQDRWQWPKGGLRITLREFSNFLGGSPQTPLDSAVLCTEALCIFAWAVLCLSTFIILVTPLGLSAVMWNACW